MSRSGERRYIWYGLAGLLLLAVAVLASFAAPGPAEARRSSGPQVDPALQNRLEKLDEGESIRAILVYDAYPTQDEIDAVEQTGVATHIFDQLPMIAVQGTRDQVEQLFSLQGPASIWANKKLEYMLHESRPLIGADRVQSELGYAGEGVGVAVIDSGVDGTHQDIEYPERTVQNVKILADTFFTGTTVYAEDVPNTDTSSGHGTHVTGTVGGDGTESGGYYTGIAPESDLVGIGAGDALFILYALEAFDYALEHQEDYNIKVINNSWGTEGKFKRNDPVNQASKLAHDRGITVVFAAGNEGPKKDTLNPYSVAPWVIGVAAGKKDGKTLARFSSRGRPGSDLYHPTLTAPGVNIVSARASTGSTINSLDAADDATYIPPEYVARYTTASGTSMATPHVSGTVALMLQANPNLTPDEVKEILVKTATSMPYQRYEAGAGYLNAYKAVTRASSAASAANQPALQGSER